MGIVRSTFYDDRTCAHDDTAIVEAMAAICDEFEFYGWRRVRAELRHRGMVVNHKKIRRLMREHDLQPRQRRRYVATTDSDHDQPIYPNRTKDLTIDGPNQLWVADITYVAIVEGFAYVAVILDAWSRQAVGYAISRSIDVRLTSPRSRPHPEPRASSRLCPPLGSRFAIRRSGLSGRLASRRSCRFDGTPRQSLRQRQGRELHEDPQGRSRLSNGLRRLRRCRQGPSAVHRRGLQPASSPFRSGLSQPTTVRGPQPPAYGQISGLIAVRPEGPSPIRGQICAPIDRRPRSGCVGAIASSPGRENHPPCHDCDCSGTGGLCLGDRQARSDRRRLMR